MSESRHGIPYPGPLPLPTPEHQRRIKKNKWFEVLTVIALIVGGVSFLAWRNYRESHHIDPAITLGDSAKAIVSAGGVANGSTNMFGRQFLSYYKDLDDFVCHIDLVGVAQDQPLETQIAWLTPMPGKTSPSPESMQKAVNAVGVLAQSLVSSSSQALETASKTMELISDTKRPHEKGVAGTNDGWKVTYVTYRSFDEHVDPQPVLCLVLQRLSAASNDQLSGLNRTLYEAIHQGSDVIMTLKAASGESK